MAGKDVSPFKTRRAKSCGCNMSGEVLQQVTVGKAVAGVSFVIFVAVFLNTSICFESPPLFPFPLLPSDVNLERFSVLTFELSFPWLLPLQAARNSPSSLFSSLAGKVKRKKKNIFCLLSQLGRRHKKNGAHGQLIMMTATLVQTCEERPGMSPFGFLLFCYYPV